MVPSGVGGDRWLVGDSWCWSRLPFPSVFTPHLSSLGHARGGLHVQQGSRATMATSAQALVRLDYIMSRVLVLLGHELLLNSVEHVQDGGAQLCSFCLAER